MKLDMESVLQQPVAGGDVNVEQTAGTTRKEEDRVVPA